jgi:hypothetical protein
MENPSVLTHRNSMISKATQVYEEGIIPKVNQENTTIMRRKDQVTRTLYRHPNHNSLHLNKLVYQHCIEQKQLTYILKKCNVPTLGHHYIAEVYDDQSSQMDVIASTWDY